MDAPRFALASAIAFRPGRVLPGPRLRPGIRVALGLLAFAAIWLSHLALVSLAPPTDDIEQLTWVRSLQWGYYKHPPLPTWLLWLPVRLFGLSAWTGYVAGALLTLGAMALLWRLLSTLRGVRYASIALLAALCITYYNGRLYYYNHNIVLLLFSTASASLCWQAFASRRLRWWLALGLAIGLGALAKYQIAVTVASVLVFAWQQRAWRDPVHRRGALLAALAALAVFAPHLAWLCTHDFAPLHYAMSSSLGVGFDRTARALNSSAWLLDQLCNRALPALLLLALVARTAPRTGGSRPPADPARALLLAWGFTPLLFMFLLGLAAGADLQLQWGTAFLLFLAPAVMELCPGVAWGEADGTRALRGFLVIQALLLGLSYATSPKGPAGWRDHHWRAFDAAGLARHVAAPARAALGAPIRVVSGSAAPAGALALELPERPLVLIDGRVDRSPWVPADLVSRCGAVELGPADTVIDGRPLGPQFPGLAWRVVRRDPAAPPCPA